MKTFNTKKTYTLKNGTKYLVEEEIHYCDYGYWLWKYIFCYSDKPSIVITESRGYYYNRAYLYGDNFESYSISRN